MECFKKSSKIKRISKTKIRLFQNVKRFKDLSAFQINISVWLSNKTCFN